MNKTLSIILIILLSFLIVGLIGLMIFLANGNFDFSFGGRSTNLVDEKEIVNIKDIKILSDIADVDIVEGDTNTIKIELYSDYAKTHNISEEDNAINVELKEKNSFVLFRKNSYIKITMPKEYDKLITINTKTGDLSAGSFENAKYSITATTGDVTIEEADSAKITVTTGDVEITKINDLENVSTTGDSKIGSVKNVDITVTTGDIEIKEVEESLNIDTTTGDIDIEKATIIKNSNIKTTTGDVNIDNISGCYIDANSKVGDTNIKNNDRKSDIELKINTKTGDIDVNN